MLSPMDTFSGSWKPLPLLNPSGFILQPLAVVASHRELDHPMSPIQDHTATVKCPVLKLSFSHLVWENHLFLAEILTNTSGALCILEKMVRLLECLKTTAVTNLHSTEDPRFFWMQ